MGEIFKGWQAKICIGRVVGGNYLLDVEIGCARRISLAIKNNLDEYYAIDNPNIIRTIPGEFEITGSLGRAFINCYYLNLLNLRKTDGSLDPNCRFDLLLQAAPFDAPVVYLYNCRFTKGIISIPQNGWIEEEYDFIVLGYQAAEPGKAEEFPPGFTPDIGPVGTTMRPSSYYPCPMTWFSQQYYQPYYLASQDPNDDFIYINWGSPSPRVAKYQISIDSIVTSFGITSSPRKMCICGNYLYISHALAGNSKVTQVDLTTFTPTTVWTTNVYYGASIECDGTYVYLGGRTSGSTGRICRIRISDGNQTNLEFGRYVYDLHIVGSYMYVTDFDEGVHKVDLGTYTKIATLILYGANTLSHYGGYLYVGLLIATPNVSKIDLSTFTLVTSITCSYGFFISSTVREGFLFEGYNGPGKIVAIDLNTFTEICNISLPSGHNNVQDLVTKGNYLYSSTYNCYLDKIRLGS